LIGLRVVPVLRALSMPALGHRASVRVRWQLARTGH